MIHFVKHFAFRFWTTLLLGGLSSLAILSVWPPPMALEWLIVPAAAVFSLIFFLSGWASNRLGLSQIERLRDEAAVWERAGLPSEAEAAFQKALSLYDSFLLSPRSKKKNAITLITQMARFYLARADKSQDTEAFILAYLERHPGDSEFAENWLQQIDSHRLIEKKYQDIAYRIGNALPDNIHIQQLLANLYASSHRTNFPAQQVYRRALSGEGMALNILKAAWSLSYRFINTLLFLVAFCVKGSIKTVIRLIDIVKTSRKTRVLLKWSVAGIIAAAVIVLIVNTIGYFVKTAISGREQKRAAESAVTDPYTLQVAAYLKPEHAKAYVATLKKLNIDAFWTEAVGNNKNWYQVRVSHFPDKKSAIAFGERLKAKGIINDFFVANY